MEDVYFVLDLKNNILSMIQLLEKGCSVIMKDRMLYLNDRNDRLLTHVEMAKNWMFNLNLKNITRKVFTSQHGGQSTLMALMVWTLTLQRAKRVSKGHGPWTTKNGLHQEVL